MFIILASIFLSVSTIHSSDTCKRWKDTLTGREIYVDADTKPEPEGGEVSLMRRLNKGIRYPESALTNEIETTFLVAFIVEANGKISGERILKDNTNQIGRQILKVIESCHWYPGKCHGRKVAMLVKRPVIIELQAN